MKKETFIIMSIIYWGVCFLLAFILGPDMLGKAKEVETKPNKIYNEIQQMDFFFLTDFKSNLRITIHTNEDEIATSLNVDEDEQKPFIDLLQKNNIIQSEKDFFDSIPVYNPPNVTYVGTTTSFRSDIPFSFKKEQLHSLKSLEILYDEGNKIQYLGINGQLITGSLFLAKVRKTISYIAGGIMFFVGILGIILIPFGTYLQLKDNTEKGTPLYISNWFNGIRKFIKLFKK